MLDSNSRTTIENVRRALADKARDFTDEELAATVQFVKRLGTADQALAALKGLEILRKTA